MWRNCGLTPILLNSLLCQRERAWLPYRKFLIINVKIPVLLPPLLSTVRNTGMTVSLETVLFRYAPRIVL